MKFAAVIAALISVGVNAASLGKRQSIDCITALKEMSGYDRPFVWPLYDECNLALGTEQAKQNPWSNKNCVAAAVVASVRLERFHTRFQQAADCGTTDADIP